jgi:hypothetical protein
VRQGVERFDWYIENVTIPAAAKHGVMQGVVWTIPEGIFQFLGGRLTEACAELHPDRSHRPVIAGSTVYASPKNPVTSRLRAATDGCRQARRGTVRSMAAGIASAVDTSAGPDHPIGRHIAKSRALYSLVPA